MFAAAAATSMLTLYGSPALADSHADGAAANSPGVLSGNVVQVPVHVPVNVCGNTVNVVALLNPAFGNTCANGSAPPVATPTPTPPPVTTPTPTPPPVATPTPTLPPVTTPTPTLPPVATPTPTLPPVATPTPTLPPVATPTPTLPPVATPTLPPVATPVQTPVDATPDAGTPVRVVDEAAPEPQRAQTLPAPASFEEGTPDAAPQLAETGTGALLASSAASAALIAGGMFLYRRGRTATQRQS
ncbi:chaplin [Streptomyces sp. NPDC017179]|uniref:chaplin n=1 Tax=Streptomyces sp. NPDC017179 TaxID=3364979 RepID=UPI0037B90ED7